MKVTFLSLALVASFMPWSAFAGESRNVFESQALLRTDEVLKSLYRGRSSWAATSMTSRVVYYANVFLTQKSPYIIDPLGEGDSGKVSQKPLYRFDGFDCTTFVETVLSLAWAENPEQFKTTMNRVRYKDGRVSFEARNHFPSTDWIPNNTKAGFVKDVTGSVAGARTKWAQTWIEKGEWFRRKGEEFSSMSKSFGRELGQIPYISKEDLLSYPQLVDRIPSGSIFHLVRTNWKLQDKIGTDLDVSHEGFLIRENGVLYMVHASNGLLRDGSDDYMGVKKEPLLSYIERVMQGKSSMAGFNIVQIQTPGKSESL